MLHLTTGIFGNPEFAGGVAKKLGKQGTSNDIAIYNHGSSEGVLTYVTVVSDKIQPLLQAINMVDVPVVAINELNALVGEQLIAISEFCFDNGFLILDNVSEEQVRLVTKGTCIENFALVANERELVEEIKKTKIERKNGDLFIPIDNYFNVKSVGTVALGIVKSGTVRKYDKVVVEPLGKEVVVKGIQSQDKDIDSADAGTRVGLNLKGVEAEEIKRGYVVGKAMKSRSLVLEIQKSKYSKEAIKENDQVFLSSGLQVVAAKIKAARGNEIDLESESYIAYTQDTKFLLASTKQQMPRIIGRAELN